MARFFYDTRTPQRLDERLDVIRWLGHWDAVWVLVIMPCLFVLWLRSELRTFD